MNKKLRRQSADCSGVLAPYLGPPTLLAGESEKSYNELAKKLIGYVKPKDVFEEIWTRDIIDLQWEVTRARRLKAALLNADQRTFAERTLASSVGFSKAPEIYKAGVEVGPQELEKIGKYLKLVGFTADELAANTLARRLDQVERIDYLAVSAEMRRGRAIRELGEHRERFAKIMSAAIREVEDAEFKEIGAEGGAAQAQKGK